MAAQIWLTAKRLICQYDLFSQTVHLIQAMRKGTFFCFSVTSYTIHEEPRTFYCCRSHKFAIKTLLCDTLYFHV